MVQFLIMEAGDLLVPGVEEGAVGKWAEMPTDVLREIGGAIQGVEDYVSFASVCKSWHSRLFSSRWECPESSKRRLEYPWLMLVEQQQGEEEEEECVGKRGFYSLYSGKQFNLDLPESCGRACFGTSCGWLLTLGLDLKVHLLNPITRQQLPLPSITTLTDPSIDPKSPKDLRRVFIHKVLVTYDDPVAATEDPRTPLVFVIYGNYRVLSMARPGDSSWTPIPHSSLDRGFLDVSRFRDQVVVYNHKQIMICHFSESPPRFEDVCAPPPPSCDRYIVDLGGELYFLGSSGKTSPRNGRCIVKMRFTAYKLDFGKKTWEEVDTLGGWAVFVGRNSSFALSSSDYPQCRPNCIYFTDDDTANFHTCGGCDWGIYHYENRSRDTDSDESEVENDTANEWNTEESHSDKEGDGEENPSDNLLFDDEDPCIPDDPNEITLNPFPVSYEQFSTYSPLLWVAPNLW